MPKAMGCQLRVEALQPEIDLRCRPPTLFKRELLQQLYNIEWQRDSPDRSPVLRGAYSNLHSAELQIEIFTLAVSDLTNPRTAIDLNQDRDELSIKELWQKHRQIAIVLFDCCVDVICFPSAVVRGIEGVHRHPSEQTRLHALGDQPRQQ